MADSLLVGLMSGTSIDAIDAALVRIDSQGQTELVDCLEFPLTQTLREQIAQLSQPGDNEIERLGALDRALGRQFGRAVLALLDQTGLSREKIAAIGSHGQTLRHRPPSAPGLDDEAFTLQAGCPHTLAEITGICTVADFRRRDVAAGGEGAPLVPAFHQAVFSSKDESRAILNIGGIANVTLLDERPLRGFDTGPGNTLLDHWITRHRGERYDPGGSWAAEGQVNDALLETMMSHPYLSRSAPKSTGKEAFNLQWLDSLLLADGEIEARDVQATLAEFTAASIADALAQDAEPDTVYVCGGGAANQDLMRRLYKRLQNATLASTLDLGIDPAWVEAVAFAWLAHQTLSGLPGNAPEVTGARGPRILGTVFPAA